MRTTMFATLVLSATVALRPSSAHAQSSSQVFDYKTSTNACAVNDNNAASSSTSCSAPVTGGTGATDGHGDRTARIASSSGSLVQAGSTSSMAAISEGRGFVYSTFTLAGMGTLAQQTQLVFHFDLTESATAHPGSPNSLFDYAFEGLFLDTPSGGKWHYNQTYVNGQINTYDDFGVTKTGGSVAYAFNNALGDGTYSYFYETATENYLHSAEQAGTSISSSVSAFLRAIDVTTMGGDVLYTASFDANGAASIEAESEPDPETSSAPEPATLSLAGLGLASMFAMRRKVVRR